MKEVHCLGPVKYMQQAKDTDFTTTSKDILNGLQNKETEKRVWEEFISIKSMVIPWCFNQAWGTSVWKTC